METLWFNTKLELEEILNKMIKETKSTRLRFFEHGKSVEDFSISYKLDGTPIRNFTIEEDNDNLIIKKKAKGSTKHITFNRTNDNSVILSTTKRKIIKININSNIYYLDGSRRYANK